MLIYKGTKYILEVIITDSQGNRMSGLTVFYKVFKSDTNDLIQEGVMTDKGNGLYQAEFLCSTVGQYRIEYIMPEGWDDKVETVIVVENKDYQVQDIYDIVKRIVGLSQENYVLIPLEYNSLLQMTKGQIKIYSSSEDCLNEQNEQYSYYIEAQYDTEGRLLKYKVVKEL